MALNISPFYYMVSYTQYHILIVISFYSLLHQYVCVEHVIKSIALNTEWKVLINVLENSHQRGNCECSVNLVSI